MDALHPTHTVSSGGPPGLLSSVNVGVLALQGAFVAHQIALETCDVAAPAVRTAADLDGVDAVVMPGGESTVMSKLLHTSGLFGPIAERLAGGMPTLGTCAGMILLARHVEGARPDQRWFAALDIGVQRNGYGRQLQSREADIDVVGFDEPFRAVFIRAPRVIDVGDNVEILATWAGDPVLLRSGAVTVASFHPEIAGDFRIHHMFVESIRAERTK